jgi:hypothetical protein
MKHTKDRGVVRNWFYSTVYSQSLQHHGIQSYPMDEKARVETQEAAQ